MCVCACVRVLTPKGVSKNVRGKEGVKGRDRSSVQRTSDHILPELKKKKVFSDVFAAHFYHSHTHLGCERSGDTAFNVACL